MPMRQTNTDRRRRVIYHDRTPSAWKGETPGPMSRFCCKKKRKKKKTSEGSRRGGRKKNLNLKELSGGRPEDEKQKKSRKKKNIETASVQNLNPKSKKVSPPSLQLQLKRGRNARPRPRPRHAEIIIDPSRIPHDESKDQRPKTYDIEHRSRFHLVFILYVCYTTSYHIKYTYCKKKKTISTSMILT